MKVHIRSLGQELLLSCCCCQTLFTQGKFILEFEKEGKFFVFAELWSCCGDPTPVVSLFESQEPAEEAGTRLIHNASKTPWVNLPLLSKEIARASYPSLFF